MKQVMVLSKETKGTFVYACDEDGAAVTVLYVKKSAFATAPKQITLTIEAKGE